MEWNVAKNLEEKLARPQVRGLEGDGKGSLSFGLNDHPGLGGEEDDGVGVEED